MDSFMSSAQRYLGRMSGELLDIAKTLDDTGWAVVTCILLVCGWFFLKGNKIRST